MGQPREFAALLAALKQGDSAARQEFGEAYWPEILSAAKAGMGGSSLAKRVSVEELADLVWETFCTRAAAGALTLTDSHQLGSLLERLADHAIMHLVRREHAKCRDIDRLERLPVEEFKICSREIDPSRAGEASDALDRCAEELSDEEFWIAFELKANDRTLAEIAAIMGKSPDAIRMQYNRARERLQDKLGSQFEP